MKKLTLVLPLLCLTLFAGAQKISNYYKLLGGTGQTLLFFDPMEFDTDGPAAKKVEGDFTTNFVDTTMVSTAFKFTVITDDILPEIESISITTGDSLWTKASSIVNLYSEPDGKKWTNRFTASLPTADMVAVFEKMKDEDPQINLYTEYGTIILHFPKDVTKISASLGKMMRNELKKVDR